MSESNQVHIIGAGLAGSEAAWQIANQSIKVILHEMRPVKKTFAHQTDHCAELVCSNSFRSDDAEYNAVGLIHQEMRKCNSLILGCADQNQVPAGSALAVAREAYSQMVTEKLEQHENITLSREEIKSFEQVPGEHVIVATGPLTSELLTTEILKYTKQDSLAFFDAIAPIVYKESVNMEKAWFQSRYDKVGPAGTGKDYLNCAMNKEEYFAFIEALLAAEKTEFKDWEKDTPYFEGCLPIEVMAERGIETLRYGPLKPKGLTNPHHPDEKPYAVVQLRQDNALGTLYNLVGFQTKMKYGAQKEVLTMIPGLEEAEFARLGGIHRNTFINSPELLNQKFQLKSHPRFRFAGQITGVEGYVESAAMGLLTGRMIAAEILGRQIQLPPQTTAMGALAAHITGDAIAETFQPMNVNFGLFPPLENMKIKGKDRKKAYTDRARDAFDEWLSHR